ncbi:MAG: xanthine dehydrogenase family protein subunit M [Actinomycetia bacterium]|nr:xanthine dehydrogenase family protein subunit M [Actinomycetes bacterium]
MTRSFQHLRPDSPREACEMKAKHGSKAVFWAGGTDLLLQWRRGAIDFEYCIDVSGLGDLRQIRSSQGVTTIGALATIASLQTHESLGRDFPVLLDMAARFATPQIRNVATIGGNLCHGVPSADSAPPLIALGAEVKLMSTEGERVLPLESFFEGPKKTALREGEMLAGISIQRLPARSACTFERMARSYVDIALASAACRLTVDDEDHISQARIVLGAVAPVPLRSVGAEELLVGAPLADITEDLLDEVAERSASDARPISDVRTTAVYRKHMSGVLTKRAVAKAVRRLAE